MVSFVVVEAFSKVCIIITTFIITIFNIFCPFFLSNKDFFFYNFRI